MLQATKQASFLSFTLDRRDHHHISGGFPQLLELAETLQRGTAIPFVSSPVQITHLTSVRHLVARREAKLYVSRGGRKNFDPVTGTIEVMVANEAFTIGIWRSIIVNVDRQLQVLKANVLADVGEIGKRIDAIESYNLPLEGDDGSVWTPFLAYQDGNAFVPNLLCMFTGNTTSNSHTKLAGDARVLMTRLGVRTVVAYNLPLPSKLEPINMDRFVKRASTTVWVFDDCQSKPISIKQEGLSTALWISDFLNKPRALHPKFVRPRGGDE